MPKADLDKCRRIVDDAESFLSDQGRWETEDTVSEAVAEIVMLRVLANAARAVLGTLDERPLDTKRDGLADAFKAYDALCARPAEGASRKKREPKLAVGDIVEAPLLNIGPWNVPVKRLEGRKVVVEFTYAGGSVLEQSFDRKDVKLVRRAE